MSRDISDIVEGDQNQAKLPDQILRQAAFVWHSSLRQS